MRQFNVFIVRSRIYGNVHFLLAKAQMHSLSQCFPYIYCTFRK